MIKLTWTDLIVENITPQDFERWLQPWAPVLGGGPIAPVFLSKFGTWFLRRPAGHVEMLDIFTGEVARRADTYAEFVAEVNKVWWQEAFLLSKLVYRLHEEGKVPGPDECYGLAPPPALGGPNPLRDEPFETRFIMVLPINVWQHLCVQSVLGPR